MYGCSAGMSYAPEDLDKHSLTNKDGHKVEDTSYKVKLHWDSPAGGKLGKFWSQEF